MSWMCGSDTTGDPNEAVFQQCASVFLYAQTGNTIHIYSRVQHSLDYLCVACPTFALLIIIVLMEILVTASCRCFCYKGKKKTVN